MSSHPVSRRGFLSASAAALAATASAPHGVHADGGDLLKVGLIGCGGRGTGAAVNALTADPNVKLTAMGDAFADKLNASLKQLVGEFPAKVDVPADRRFVGFDAYRQVIDSGVDVVLLTSPPHFRPMHLQYAVEKNKHVFCEKPMAVDGPGVRSILQSAESARKKNLNLMSGFCFRYDPPKRETVARIHDGAVGDIVAMHVTYNTGYLWHVDRAPGMTEMTWQLRNWPYFTWLSGDHICEQHIHNLDKAAWAMKEAYPISASGMGGRQVRTDPKYGHIFDHHSVVFEYSNGVKLFSFCRQIDGCQKDVNDHIMGTKGSAQLMKHSIAGPAAWRWRGKPVDMYQVEHNELFAAIRSGKPINDGESMAKSSLMAILGRLASYSGKVVTWEQALNSPDLSPPRYDWDVPLSVPAVPMPGQFQIA